MACAGPVFIIIGSFYVYCGMSASSSYLQICKAHHTFHLYIVFDCVSLLRIPILLLQQTTSYPLYVLQDLLNSSSQHRGPQWSGCSKVCKKWHISAPSHKQSAGVQRLSEQVTSCASLYQQPWISACLMLHLTLS